MDSKQNGSYLFNMVNWTTVPDRHRFFFLLTSLLIHHILFNMLRYSQSRVFDSLHKNINTKWQKLAVGLDKRYEQPMSINALKM